MPTQHSRVNFSDEVLEIPTRGRAQVAGQGSHSRSQTPPVIVTHTKFQPSAQKPLRTHPLRPVKFPETLRSGKRSGSKRRDLNSKNKTFWQEYKEAPPGDSELLWKAIKDRYNSRKEKKAQKLEDDFSHSLPLIEKDQKKQRLGTRMKKEWKHTVEMYKTTPPSSSALFFEFCKGKLAERQDKKRAKKKSKISRPTPVSEIKTPQNCLDLGKFADCTAPPLCPEIRNPHAIDKPQPTKIISPQLSSTFRFSNFERGAVRVADFPTAVREAWHKKHRSSSVYSVSVYSDSDESFYCQGHIPTPPPKTPPPLPPKNDHTMTKVEHIVSPISDRKGHEKTDSQSLEEDWLKQYSLWNQGQQEEEFKKFNRAEALTAQRLSMRDSKKIRFESQNFERNNSDQGKENRIRKDIRESSFYYFWDDLLSPKQSKV